MDPAIVIPPLNIPVLLRDNGLRPKKRLGQNFLVDDSALRKVVDAAEITGETTVLEVGPGLGSLTRYLAYAAQRVVAVELDKDLLPVLQQVLSLYPNVSIIQGDILDLDPGQLLDTGSFSVVANIPYYITSALFRHFLEARARPEKMVLTVQKEVAARLCALPDEMNLLALSVQVYGIPAIVARIPAGAFYPVPDVDSSVVRVNLLDQPVIPPGQLDLFFLLARAAFSQKRKTLRNALAHALPVLPQQIVDVLLVAGINPQRRAETVSLAEWKVLTGLVSQAGWLK